MYGKIRLSPTNLNIQIHDLNTTRWVWYTTSSWDHHRNGTSSAASSPESKCHIQSTTIQETAICVDPSHPLTSDSYKKKRYEHSKSHSSTVKASSGSIQGTPSMSLTPPKSWANFSCFVRSLAGHVGSEATEYHHGIPSCLVMFSDVYWI